ncbi:MAG TPA: transglutaminase family protein [Caulobacteraceae bacterium]
MPGLSIRHLTRYRYRRPVGFGEHRMMFRPHEGYDQRVLSSLVTITPSPSRLRYVQDVFGNCVGIARFDTRAAELSFESRVRLEHTPLPAFADLDGEIEPYTGAMPFAYSPADMPDLLRSMERHHPDPDGVLEAWARRFVKRSGPTSLQGLLAEMTGAIHADFRYRSRLEGAAQSPQLTLRSRRGSCRDFAMLMIEAARSLGLAARYVSGYLYSPARGPVRIGSGASGHTHAWVRVYLPACGWVEFDPTNGIVGNSDLVRVAIARDPRQAVPLHGTFDGFASDFQGMDVEVEVVSDEATGWRQFPLAARAEAA